MHVPPLFQILGSGLTFGRATRSVVLFVDVDQGAVLNAGKVETVFVYHWVTVVSQSLLLTLLGLQSISVR